METFIIAATLIGKLLDKTPDYPDNKRLKYHNLVRALRAELTKDYPSRDDDLVMNLRDDIVIMQKHIISHTGE